MLHALRDQGFELLWNNDGDEVYVHRDKKLVAIDLNTYPCCGKNTRCSKCWPRLMDAVRIADEQMKAWAT